MSEESAKMGVVCRRTGVVREAREWSATHGSGLPMDGSGPPTHGSGLSNTCQTRVSSRDIDTST
ncbi:hypothetical protein HanIR_Chr04g0156091 [Helianthus annuus]|nr:hypothetical protein HanIR_Chr04g0156091 [Helianthus annuus]